ncbi:MAG: CaiB/BaiF CoA transferase family protein [Candidatus Binatia bacterium]
MSVGPLRSLRVVELGSGVAAAYAGKLFADLGADVVKIESPDGDVTRRHGPYPGGRVDPETSGLFLYLNSNKRGGVLDLDDAAGRRSFERLLARADVSFTDLPPKALESLGLLPAGQSRRHERLVATAITPFGLTGPRRDWHASDLTLWNAGGVATLNGLGPGGDELPPLAAYGPQASLQGGINGAVATMGAIFARHRTGRGQTVDVSIQECIATILELTLPFWPYCSLAASRLGAKPIQPLDFFECKDGWIFLCAVEEHQWKSFLDFIGNPEWAGIELFADRLSRGANWDALKPMIQEWMSEQNVQDIYRKLQERRVPIAPVSTMGDLLASEHLNARGFFVSFDHPRAGKQRVPGAPFHFSRTPWELRRPAPLLGQHTEEILAEAGA